MVFLEVTINVPPKAEDFLGMALKWSLLQFTEWWNQVHEDLCETVSLILLFYIGSSIIEPEAIHDMTKHTISKYVYNFWPNNKAFSKGYSYQMYCKIWVSTNVLGRICNRWLRTLRESQTRSQCSSWSFNTLTHKLMPGFWHLIITWIRTGFPRGWLRNVLH
jgi:hypothetical protein